MILRRVMEHVKTQNWTAVALGFVIFGAGALAGAKINTWNEDRTAAARQTQAAENQTDPAAVSPEFYTVLFENDHMRAVEYALPPNANDNPHTHPPKFMYALEGGTLLITPDSGAPFESAVKAGDGEWSPARGLHSARNIGDTTVRILLIEPKSAGGKSE